MINLTNIHSVTDFQRNPKGILGKLKKSKNPIVLTVNGKAELVVQDAKSYQHLLDKVQAAEDLNAVREGLVQSLAGLGRPAKNFFKEFENERGLQTNYPTKSRS
jgi:PHD/YefM family antitoxin component YafN of YafNO toxin-antitoxin module